LCLGERSCISISFGFHVRPVPVLLNLASSLAGPEAIDSRTAPLGGGAVLLFSYSSGAGRSLAGINLNAAALNAGRLRPLAGV